MQNTLMDTKHYALMNCVFHKMKPQDQYIDKFIPWQELWRGVQHRWDIVTPLKNVPVGEKSYFICRWLGTYGDMKFRVNGEFVLEGTFYKFLIRSIDLITWDDSESVLAVFRD